MCNRWGVKHNTSSPRYPQSNGLVERMVRTVKTLVKKCKRSKQDIQIALLNLRVTPLDPNLPSPAEILFGRPVRTTLPSNHPPQITQKSQQVYEQLNERRGRMKGHHDTKVKVKDLPPLYPGQKVRILDYERKTWSPGEVIKVCQEPRSYDICTPNGSILRRNRQHLRELRHATPQPQHTSPQPHSTPQVHTSKVPKQLNFANGNNVQAPPKVWATNEHERKGTVKTRSGRIVVPPQRYLPEV